MFWDEIEKEAAKPENAGELEELRGMLGIRNAIAVSTSVGMTQLTSLLGSKLTNKKEANYVLG